MGKKRKIGLVIITGILLTLLTMPNTFAATTARLEWRGNDTVNVGGEIVLNIWGAGISGANLMTAGGNVSSSDTNCLTLVKLEKVASGTANGAIFAYSDMDGSANDINITKATFKAGTSTCSATININNGKLAFTDSTKLALNTVSKTITVKAPGNDATLKSLSANGYQISPNFAPNITNYKVGGVTANSGSISFNATVNDPKAGVVSGRTCNLTNKVTNCNIVVRAEDGSTKTYTIEVTKKDPDPVTPTLSNDATLKSLSSPGNNLSPGFSSNVTNYTMEAASNAKEVKFDAVVNDPKATITSGQTCELKDKTTTCQILVTAEDKSTKIYEVVVTKRDETPVGPTKSSDASLKSLDVSGFVLNPGFNKDNTTYNISVNNNITGLNVNAIPSDEKAKVTIIGNNGWKEGMNTIRITVTAEDGSEKTYIVNVNRKSANKENTPTKSSNNYLQSLIINDGELKPAFDKNNNNYNIVVPNDVESLDLKAFAEDNKSNIVIIGNDKFQMGMNVVTIEVTAEDGSVRVYTLNVNRSEKISQNKLKNLIISNGELSPHFEKDLYEYEITVDGKVKKLDLTAIPEFDSSTVEVIGNENLKEGNNAILIKVTDEFGFVQYYRLNVTKESKNTFLGLTFGTWMTILGALLIIGLLLWILFLILKKKQKEEKDPVGFVKEAPTTSPVIEFKPEFNFGSKNGTDDDIVEPGGVLNQYTNSPDKNDTNEQIETATYQEVPYDFYDDTVTKDEMFDAIDEALKTKDPAKLQILYEQERLNRQKEKLKEKELEEHNRERERLNRYK